MKSGINILHAIYLTVVFSLSLFSIFGILLSQLFSPFPILVWQILLISSIALSFIIIILGARLRWFFAFNIQFSPSAAISGHRARHRPYDLLLQCLPYMMLIPAVIAILSSVRMQLSYHGFFHSGYIFQILAGHVPPENVTLPGTPANFYWLYHAFIATLVSSLKMPPPRLAALINFILLFITIRLMREIIRILFSPEKKPFLFELFTFFGLFGMNLFGFMHVFLNRILFQKTSYNLIESYVLMGDVRLKNLFEKFLNFSGFPFGIFFYIFILFIVIHMMKNEVRMTELLLLIIASLGALTLHATTGVFIFLIIPAAVGGTYTLSLIMDGKFRGGGGFLELYQKGNAAALTGRNILFGTIILVLLMVFGWSIITFIRDAVEALPGTTRFNLTNVHTLKSIVSVSYPLIPFFIAGWVRALKSRDKSLIFLGLISFAGYVLAYLFDLPEHNQYKFIFLSSIPMCLVSLAAIKHYLFDRHTKMGIFSRVFSKAALILVCVNLIFLSFNCFLKPWFRNKNFKYDGIHMVTSGAYSEKSGTDIQYGDIFYWIRKNTPSNTIVVSPIIKKDRSTLYVLTERLPYVVYGRIYNFGDIDGPGIPEFIKRKKEVDIIFSRDGRPEEKVQAIRSIRHSMPDRPKVILYPHELARDMDLEAFGLCRLYRGRRAVLYSFTKRLR